MALTPEQLAELQRLRKVFVPLAEQARRDSQRQDNLDKMNPQNKADGGSVAANKRMIEDVYSKYPVHPFNPNQRAMVEGEGEDQTLGTFELKPSMSARNAVELDWLSAYPHKQGVGSRTLKKLQEHATEHGVGLTLFPWEHGGVSQSKLIKFYKKHGFVPTSKGGKAMIWQPKANGGNVSIDAMRLALAKGGGLSRFLKDSKEKRKLYHATFADVRKFDSNAPKQTDQDTGAHFFTPDVDFANKHVQSHGYEEPTKEAPYSSGANIMPVVVHAKHPWDYENPKHVDALHQTLVAHPQLGEEFAPSRHRLASGDWSAIEDPAVQEAIKKLGHDSFYTEEGGVKNIGIYNRRHVKSLHGNRGTYDRRSPDITKAKGGRVTHAHHLEIEERPL